MHRNRVWFGLHTRSTAGDAPMRLSLLANRKSATPPGQRDPTRYRTCAGQRAVPRSVGLSAISRRSKCPMMDFRESLMPVVPAGDDARLENSRLMKKPSVLIV